MRSKKAHQVWRKAEIHRKACEIGRPVPNQPFQLCECCDQIIHTEPMSICDHSKEFERFGYGYPMWFSFLKHCMLIVFVLIISKTATEIYIATQQNYEFCYGGAKDVLKHPKELLPSQKQSSMELSPPQLSLRHEGRLLLHSEKSQNFLVHKQAQNRTNPRTQTKMRERGENNKFHKDNSINPTGERHCTSFFVYLSYFKQQKLIKDWFLATIQFLAHLVALIYFRNALLKQQQEYNEKACLISDYTLIVRNLPAVTNLRASIISLFDQHFHKSCNSKNPHIREIIFVFHDDDLNKILEDKVRTQNQLIDAEKEQNQKNIEQKQNQLFQIDRKLQIKSQELRMKIDRDEIVCDKILVTLQSQLDKVQVLQQFEQDQQNQISYKEYFNIPPNTEKKQLKEYIFSTQILINEAHEPNQIVWKNIDSNEKTRLIRSLIGWILTAIVLTIVTFIFYFIIKGKSKLILSAVENEYQNSRLPAFFKGIALLIVLVALIGIVLFNKVILQKILRFIVREQKHGYKDKENISFALKYAIAIFFTTGLMTLIVEAFIYQNYYTHHLGLIQQQSLMFIVLALLIPLILWIHPYNMFKTCQRERVYGSLMRQPEANEMMQDYPYDMSKKYSQVFKLIWLTFLYAELIPLGSFLTLIGLFCYYWVDKYNFLNSCTRKPGISGKMSLLAVKAIDATLFLVPAGSLLFDLMLRHHFNVLSLVLMILGIVYLFLPMDDLIWRLNDQKFDLKRKSYSEAQYSFRQTYLNMHPVYSQSHKQQINLHRQKVKQYFKHQTRKQKVYGIRKGEYFREEPGRRRLITTYE